MIGVEVQERGGREWECQIVTQTAGWRYKKFNGFKTKHAKAWKKKENNAQRRIKHIKILTDKRKAIIDKARRMYKTYLINSNSSHNTS